ncbi:Ribosome biogenesis protein TSR1 [Cercospora beticola]|uniref:Ribosome biogenesis protein TSR1 n=1 Tax=Cercospora beticola TaxID=122368 RepID=A0A2G5I840_CERBT|nr:Ribosome biogenesis protein TSR1 [Cercospora beticola]PIB00945.1 Ribosome biogenesis protein TSR1 [Cercospora beticola]WPA97427.1 hypothetical protein RHO25_002037 [Cercospora beticola]
MAPEHHSHRPTTKQVNKPFKTRHASKSSLKNEQKGKVEAWEKGSRKTPQQQVMSKIDRRNRAKQLRQNHASDREDKASVFAGRDAAPRIIAVVPLCDDVSSTKAISELTGSVEADDIDVQSASIYVPRFKQNVRFLTPTRDVIQCLDACRVADFVLFVLSANEEVDEAGEELLRSIEAQGVSTVLTGVYGLDRVEPAKKRPDVVKSLKSFITHFFATQEKVHDLGNRQECSNVMRSLCTTMPKGIRWREDRSWMLLEDCQWEVDQAIVTGVVRGRGLKADRLVQLGDWPDLQIEKIVAAPLETRHKKAKKDEMTVDEPQGEQILEQATDERDDLAELAPEETTMDDLPTASVAPSERKAVLLDDHHYFNDDDRDNIPAPKRLPRGTSKYQAAWYLDDVDYSGSDLEDADEDEDEDMDVNANGSVAGPADGHFEDRMDAATEAGAPSEYPQSEMFDDRAPEDEAEQIEAYRKSRREEAEDDLEFPDEIELHPGVNARERLAKYRGLKSLRTSAWETEEDKPYEPEDYARLLEIADYKSAKNRVVKEAVTGGVKPGTRVAVYLRVPQDRRQELESLPKPTALFSLLRHEHKRTVVNVSITLSSDYPEPIKSKSPLIMQCGARRLLINPLFSAAGNTPNNVHKFDRYLHPGRTAVATFIGPVTWGSVPCLFFQAPTSSASGDAIEDLAQSLKISQSQTSQLELIATGTTLPPSTQRIIAKRIILTGHPYKIHKRVVTVRYMFFNNDDVQYFRALQLWTKRGRSGFIKETLGTHGYFKATFDAKINPLDSVAVSLYKRVWPRQAQAWRPGVGGTNDDDEEAPKLMEVEK